MICSGGSHVPILSRLVIFFFFFLNFFKFFFYLFYFFLFLFLFFFVKCSNFFTFFSTTTLSQVCPSLWINHGQGSSEWRAGWIYINGFLTVIIIVYSGCAHQCHQWLFHVLIVPKHMSLTVRSTQTTIWYFRSIIIKTTTNSKPLYIFWNYLFSSNVALCAHSTAVAENWCGIEYILLSEWLEFKLICVNLRQFCVLFWSNMRQNEWRHLVAGAQAVNEKENPAPSDKVLKDLFY